jgi:hypothetical protein
LWQIAKLRGQDKIAFETFPTCRFADRSLAHARPAGGGVIDTQVLRRSC